MNVIKKKNDFFNCFKLQFFKNIFNVTREIYIYVYFVILNVIKITKYYSY